MLAGKRISSHWVKKTLICERVSDCQLQCAEEKRFTCEGFNYRIDHSGNGQGVCELIEAPLSKIDLYAGGGHNLQVHPDYDYYERDRNASPGCYQPPGCIDCAQKQRPSTSRPLDIYRPYPAPPPPNYQQPYPSYPQLPPNGYGSRPPTAIDVYRPPSGIYEHRPPLQRPEPQYYPANGPPRPGSYGNIDRVGIEEEYYKGGKPNEEPIYYGYPQKPPANNGYHTIPSQQPITKPASYPPQHRPEYAPRPPLPPSSPDSHYSRPPPSGSYGNEPQRPAPPPYGPESDKPRPQPYLPEAQHPNVAPPSPIARPSGYGPDRPPQNYPDRPPPSYGPDQPSTDRNPSKPFNPYFVGGDSHNAWGMYGGTYGMTHQNYYNKAGADYWGVRGDHRRQDGVPFNYFDLAGPRPMDHNYAYGMHYGGQPAYPGPPHPQQIAGPPGYDDRGSFGQQWSRRPGVDGKLGCTDLF